ncbi:MAG: peroxide stress protein YaaA [Flavobacterium sp.]|nr:peroxide stress protein YaaA [Flavobacterium sp.]
MKIVISPAKSLNLEKELPTNLFSESIFLKESKKIHNILKKVKPKELSTLMDISDNLANLNWQRNQNWKLPFEPNNSRPAIYTFDGDVYGGLDVYSLPIEKIETLQNKVRILSGLYGLLKPLDLMQAYRLEMGTKIEIDDSKNLYEFWKIKITNSLNKELSQNELFINLASNEYFSAVDVKKLKVNVITPEFKDYKDGKLKVISFFAKRARGLMVRFILDTNAETIDDIKSFNYDNYQFDATLSTESHLVFTR